MIWTVLRINFVIFMFYLYEKNMYVLKCLSPHKVIYTASLSVQGAAVCLTILSIL